MRCSSDRVSRVFLEDATAAAEARAGGRELPGFASREDDEALAVEEEAAGEEEEEEAEVERRDLERRSRCSSSRSFWIVFWSISDRFRSFRPPKSDCKLCRFFWSSRFSKSIRAPFLPPSSRGR